MIPDAKNSWLPFSKNYYQILEKHWPNPVQVLLVYLCAAAVVGQGILFFVEVDPYLKAQTPWLAHDWMEYILFCLTLIPLLLVSRWLRIQAQKRALLQSLDPNSSTPIA